MKEKDLIFPREMLSRTTPTRWQLFKAKLFGSELNYPNGKLAGYMHNGIIYITKDYQVKGDKL